MCLEWPLRNPTETKRKQNAKRKQSEKQTKHRLGRALAKYGCKDDALSQNGYGYASQLDTGISLGSCWGHLQLGNWDFCLTRQITVFLAGKPGVVAKVAEAAQFTAVLFRLSSKLSGYRSIVRRWRLV